MTPRDPKALCDGLIMRTNEIISVLKNDYGQEALHARTDAEVLYNALIALRLYIIGQTVELSLLCAGCGTSWSTDVQVRITSVKGSYNITPIRGWPACTCGEKVTSIKRILIRWDD